MTEIFEDHILFETEQDRRYVSAIDCFSVPSYCFMLILSQMLVIIYIYIYLYYYLRENY